MIRLQSSSGPLTESMKREDMKREDDDPMRDSPRGKSRQTADMTGTGLRLELIGMTPPRVPLISWGLLVLTGVYFLAGKFGLSLAFVHASASAVWPPTGIALAATLLLGYRVWPALFLGAFLVNVTTAGSVWTSLGIRSGHTLGGLLGRFLLLLGSVLLVGEVVFGGLGSAWAWNYPLEFLCIPPLVVAAFRFGPREAATCVALLSVLANWGTLHGLGPFVRYTPNESLLLLQAFMGTMAMMTLLLAVNVKAHARTEAALARVAAIVESSADAIIGKTLDGIITTWNAGAERLYGYAAREVVGRPISIVIPPQVGDELPEILDRLARGERVEHYETVRVARDGRRIEVSITVSPTLDPAGRVIGASSIARDITHRKEAEAAVRERDALRYVASLAAAAAHEINNPLAVVVGQAELLDETLDATGQKRTEEILQATRRIEEIVGRMKGVSRLKLTSEAAYVPEMLDLDKSSEPGAGSPPSPARQGA